MNTHLYINGDIRIPLSEITFHPIRAQGAGGQNVNKVASAIQLRFDIVNSSLPPEYRESLLRFSDQRITSDGIVVIKAQRHRTQEKNREDGLARLQELIRAASHRRKKRTPTRPSKKAKQKRLDSKVKRGRVKALRGKVKV